VPFDPDSYVRRVRAEASAGECFICSIVSGRRDDHLIVARDELCIAFLAKFPTLLGCCLVAPLEHLTAVVDDFTEDWYAEMQRRVHRVGRALSRVVPTERLYVLSLGSAAGNAHVHWHVAPLPPGVPYAEQQYAALMHENGYLDLAPAEEETLARAIERELERDELQRDET
jgi:diadenosine tetraphosphate (Ap4A) HIT family hydrolase